MHLSDYARHDATGLAQLVRSGAVSATELAEAALAARAAVDPTINAVIETWPGDVAEAIAAVPAGAPFAGVPFVIKDAVLHMAGKRCEIGSRLCEGAVAEADSELMRRFRAAGLVTVGRTASPEMAFSITTEPVLNGPSRNPWAPDRSVGGSSGGAAAAVAAGIVPLAHANDGGGSIRIPAACCGVFGIKPSRGRVPIGPDSDEGLQGLGQELAVSRSVRDSAALLDAVQGPAVGEPFLIAPPAGPYVEAATRDPAPLRIGLMTQAWGGDRTDPAIAAAVEEVGRLCAALGHRVEPVAPALGIGWDAFLLLNARIWCANLAAWVGAASAATGRPIDADMLEPPTLAAHAYGAGLSAVDLLEAFHLRNLVARSIGRFFASHDILLTPTLPGPPARIGAVGAGADRLDGLGWTERLFNLSPFTPLFNVTGLPAMSMPLAQGADGLPIGIQFGAGFGREDRLFALAGQLERARPWAQRRPTIFAGGEDR